MTSKHDCEEVRIAAMALADGETSTLDQRQIGEHSENCEPCRVLLGQEPHRLIPESARRAQHVADFWPAIEARLPAVNRADRKARFPAFLVFGGAASACALVLVVAGGLWISLGRGGLSGLIGHGAPQVTPSTSKPLPYDDSWDPPAYSDPAEFRERFAYFFDAEFQKEQRTRISADLNVDALHSVIISAQHGPLGTLFIDRAGVVLLAVPYPLVDDFHEGLATVGTRTNRKEGNRIEGFGFIDRTGELVIAPEYDLAFWFSEGLAAVRVKDKWGYVNRLGQLVIEPRYRVAEPFRDGLACVELPDSNTVDFIDAAGKPQFTVNRADVGQFSEGLLYVNLPGTPGVDSGRARGYVDRKFEFVFRLGENSSGFWPGYCKEFHDGMAAVEIGSSRWGFVTREGKLAIPSEYFQVQPFSDGVAAVRRERGPPKWGYIDREGKMVIEPRFAQAGAFKEGLAPVMIVLEDEMPAADPARLPRVKWGYIDRAGSMVIEPRFYSAGAFRGGLARVSENPFHTGFIDQTGTYIWQFTEPAFGAGSSDPNR